MGMATSRSIHTNSYHQSRYNPRITSTNRCLTPSECIDWPLPKSGHYRVPFHIQVLQRMFKCNKWARWPLKIHLFDWEGDWFQGANLPRHLLFTGFHADQAVGHPLGCRHEDYAWPWTGGRRDVDMLEHQLHPMHKLTQLLNAATMKVPECAICWETIHVEVRVYH